MALAKGAAPADAPDFTEVYQLIRTNANVNDAELQRAAVRGLVSELSPRAQWITNTATQPSETEIITRSSVFEDNLAYVRIGAVSSMLPASLQKVIQQHSSSIKLTGVVIDLRYTSGTDYEAAGKSAELFIPGAQPLLKWSDEVVSSTAKTDTIQLPLAILVNRNTSGAAEALAAVLRSTGAGLILGNRTAGHGFIVRDYPLRDGSTLRLAADPVSLANGTLIGTNGVKPDIDVTVSAEEERVYYADAFSVARTDSLRAMTNGVGTNQLAGARRTRFGEAELVREHRAGIRRGGGSDAPEMPGETPQPGRPGNSQSDNNSANPHRPVVNDPALARALDLLKGLAVVRQSRL